MKTLIAYAALATLIVTPALAETTKQSARQSRPQLQQTHTGNSRFDVYVNGRYVGRDPDAFVRMQLMNDPEHGGEGSGGGGE
jgi:hypothetical protein